MKCIISPSKTKTLQGTGGVAPIFANRVMPLVDAMAQLTPVQMEKVLKAKPVQALSWLTWYQDYTSQPAGLAMASYDGIAFKYAGWSSISEEAQQFGEDHLRILSGLYGVVTPRTMIKDYRLDVGDPLCKFAPSLEGTNLYPYWRSVVTDYFADEDWILNLASQEYSKLVDHPRMVTVAFFEIKNGVRKQMSTSSKMMRGTMVHYVLAHQVTQVEQLPVVLGNFHRVTDVPSTVTESITIEYERR